MIDTHNHLLSGIDDGAKDIEETLDMCRMAFADGIRIIVATPHSFDGKFLNHVNSIKTLVRELNTKLTSIGLDLTIMPVMEVRIVAELPELLSQGKVLTLNEGKYVLLEFHPSQIQAGFENLARLVASSGFRLVLGHPEKNSMLQSTPEYLFKLLKQFKPWLAFRTFSIATGGSFFEVVRKGAGTGWIFVIEAGHLDGEVSGHEGGRTATSVRCEISSDRVCLCSHFGDGGRG